MEEFLRKSDTPVITRVNKDKLYFDLRTIREIDYPIIINTIEKMCKSLKERS